MNKMILAGVFAGMLAAGTVCAQMPPVEGQPGGGPEMQQGGPGGMPPMMRGMGGPNMKDPQEKARREKMLSLRSTAEAYKNLAELYQQQGKVDEAVVQLKKIIDLANNAENKDDPMITKHLGRVYMEIAEIYVQKNRVADAEAALNEGIEKTKTDNTDLCSQLCLQLGKVQKKAGKLAEAEKTFQKVVEMNAAKMNEKTEKK